MRMEVAIADELSFGGTCAVKGCIPKKVLVSAAEVIVRAKSMQNKGINGDIRIKWPELTTFKRTFTDSIPSTRSRTYAERGIDTYCGHADFSEETSLG